MAVTLIHEIAHACWHLRQVAGGAEHGSEEPRFLHEEEKELGVAIEKWLFGGLVYFQAFGEEIYASRQETYALTTARGKCLRKDLVTLKQVRQIVLENGWIRR
ncbi:hypothetical protein BDV96DRAFT_650055 [Lophiotrema nucula]|uniref:Uncharacterized protein n=1 Tax=Lophiotrema nucula TaxID=690887 RepID=A0A6A5YZE7_9PLEO|nr:hypothetical protein BDV96DRAFT_650055 [Lophiotrema nucula]